MNVGELLAGAGAAHCAALLAGRRLPRVWLAATVAGAAAAVAAAAIVLFAGPAWEWRSTLVFAGEPAHLRLDAVSAWFLALLNVVGAAGAAYSRGYWPERTRPDSAGRGRVWWSVMLLSIGEVLLASNGLHFLLGWEVFAVASYFLITLDKRPRDVRAAGWLYLAASHAGTLCLFAFFTLLAARTGSWDLGPVRDHPELAGLFWAALIGFGVKAGLFPLHVWLPSAHASAPSHVSALMSGVTIKIGIYGILRFSGWLPLPAGAGWAVISLGAVSALIGIAFSLAQNDLKRLLAYSSVENIGIILVGLGAGLLGAAQGGAPWGRLAMAGALLHIWNHGMFKPLLFFGAGSVLHATGTREMSRLGGLWRAMPWTAALFAIGAMAVSALPPLNGFVSEWLVYLGLFDAVTSRTPAAWAAMPAAIMLGITGALALASFVKAAATIFAGAPRTEAARQAHEAGLWMRGPMAVLAAACVILGIAPVLAVSGAAAVIGAWRGDGAAAITSAPVAALGAVQLGLAAALLTALLILWRIARRRGAERRLTWDCGFAQPAPRMQYTSGSFAGIATGWFRWILRPEQRLRRPRGYFPNRADRSERTPETVLERVLMPAGSAILAASSAVRRLQHGRLQYYIAYVAVGLAALTALAATGPRR